MGDVGQTPTGVLQAAFGRATANGWQSPYAAIFAKFPNIAPTFTNSDEHLKIIFTHDFAKAFFGDEPQLKNGQNKTDYVTTWARTHKNHKPQEAVEIATRDWDYWEKQREVMPAYLWRLQEMVIYYNPINYLAKYV